MKTAGRIAMIVVALQLTCCCCIIPGCRTRTWRRWRFPEAPAPVTRVYDGELGAWHAGPAGSLDAAGLAYQVPVLLRTS